MGLDAIFYLVVCCLQNPATLWPPTHQRSGRWLCRRSLSESQPSLPVRWHSSGKCCSFLRLKLVPKECEPAWVTEHSILKWKHEGWQVVTAYLFSTCYIGIVNASLKTGTDWLPLIWNPTDRHPVYRYHSISGIQIYTGIYIYILLLYRYIILYHIIYYYMFIPHMLHVWYIYHNWHGAYMGIGTMTNAVSWDLVSWDLWKVHSQLPTQWSDRGLHASLVPVGLHPSELSQRPVILWKWWTPKEKCLMINGVYDWWLMMINGVYDWWLMMINGVYDWWLMMINGVYDWWLMMINGVYDW